MSAQCFICCESYNNSNRKQIQCQYCDFKTCRSCMEKYLIQDDTEPVCMSPSCKRPWIHDFLSDNMYKKFMNIEYKNHTEKKLFDLESSFLPATQIEIEKDAEIESLKNIVLNKQEQIRKLKDSIMEDEIRISNIRNHRNERREARQFIKNCPSDTCRGFLSSQWKCGLCKVNVCKDCHEVKSEDNHVCDPKLVESVLLLAKDSKNCPKCATAIFKIDGCDQMFCTQCYTAFSWNTLRIETGNIHNPHYYEWMRNNSTTGEIARVPGDDGNAACQAHMLNPWVIRDAFRRSTSIPPTTQTVFWSIYRVAQHIQDVELRRYPILQPINVDANMDIRKKYMKGEISKDFFKSQLQQRDKKRRKCSDLGQIWSVFVNVCTEQVNAMISQTPISLESINNFITIMNSLTDYSNTASAGIGKRYNCVFPNINIEWQFVSIKKTN